jgi:hypothetical protein
MLYILTIKKSHLLDIRLPSCFAFDSSLVLNTRWERMPRRHEPNWAVCIVHKYTQRYYF